MRWQTVLSLLGFLCFGFIYGCDESPKIMPSLVHVEGSADKPSQVSYGTSMNFSSAGMLRAILHAGRVQTYDTKQYTWLDSGVRVDFYNGDGFHSSALTSLAAKVNSVNNNMTAYGRVHIVSDSGTVVDTDSLEWINQSQTLHSNAPVHIVEKNGRVTNGIGFESDQNLAHYHILRPIIETPTGEFQMNGSGEVSPNQPSLKPEQPVIPGSGAMKGATRLELPAISDTSAKTAK